MNCIVSCTFLFILIFAGAFSEDNCPQCVPSDNCQHFNNMNRRDQKNWKDQFSCQYSTKDDSSYLHELSSVTQEEYVCCPGFSNIKEEKVRSNFLFGPRYQSPYFATSYKRYDFAHNQRKNFRIIDSNNNNGKLTQLPNIFKGLQPTTTRPPGSNSNYNIFQPGFKNVGIVSTPRPQFVYPVSTPNGKTVNMRPQIPNMNTANTKGSDECQTIISSIPDNDCCGVDTFGLEGTTDLRNVITVRIANLNSNNTRLKRQIKNDNTVKVHVDNRIAGGLETELNQFPWTVLLRATFDFGGNNISKFDCGGSIISSRYILTAAHCVTEDDATFKDVVIYLAEYDKRTFPRDCKVSANGMTSCINNILMNAEKVIPHTAFNSKSLQNDIALIRLRGSAPYTEFIRHICLPPFDIDNEAFYDLPLPVAGWGRNGPFVSNVKQSTVLNLVGRNVCLQHYQYLQSSHLCAVGRTGEDTCKGDSGGPLMMVYGGKYYVVGIVSGKRSDVPCGTAIPTLFTNVFKYLQWINSNIE